MASNFFEFPVKHKGSVKEDISGWSPYPDYATMEGEGGGRTTKPWVSGPSPLSLGLMSAGFGLLDRRPSDGWSQSGMDTSGLSRAGLLGMQTYMDANKNLQTQRSTYYDHLKELQGQAILNQKFVQEQRDRQNLIDNFPEVLKSINDTGRPEFQKSIPMLQSMFAADPSKASAAAMNIISQIKIPPGKMEVHPVEGTDSFFLTQGGKFVAQIKGEGKTKVDNLTKGRLRSSLLTGELSIPQYIAQYDMLLRENGKVVDEGTQSGASKKYLVSPQLGGLKSKFDYIKDLGEDPSDFGITKESSTLRELIGESQKKIGAEDKKLLLKIQTIEGEEKFIQDLFSKGYDPTAQNFDAFWSYTFTGKPMPTTEEFADSRSYENMAMGGSQMFGYLVSGAAVREDEMLRMRMIYYPYAGDTKDDVIRKKSLRDGLINLSRSFSAEEIAQKFKDVDISDDETAANNLLNALKTSNAPNPARIQAEDGASHILQRNGIAITKSNIQKLHIANPKVINKKGEVYGPWNNHVLSFKGLNPVRKPEVQEVIPFEPETSILSESDLLKLAKEIILEEIPTP